MEKTIPVDSCQYFNEAMETMTRAEIEALQLQRLQATVEHCMQSPFYKKRFEENGLKPSDIKTLDDLELNIATLENMKKVLVDMYGF